MWWKNKREAEIYNIVEIDPFRNFCLYTFLLANPDEKIEPTLTF